MKVIDELVVGATVAAAGLALLWMLALDVVTGALVLGVVALVTWGDWR